jgi:hypothetical protein
MLVYCVNMFQALVCLPQEYNIEYRFLVSKPVRRLGCVALGCQMCVLHTGSDPALHNLDSLQVWTPESGTHYCTPEDGHTMPETC